MDDRNAKRSLAGLNRHRCSRLQRDRYAWSVWVLDVVVTQDRASSRKCKIGPGGLRNSGNQGLTSAQRTVEPPCDALAWQCFATDTRIARLARFRAEASRPTSAAVETRRVDRRTTPIVESGCDFPIQAIGKGLSPERASKSRTAASRFRPMDGTGSVPT